MIGVCREIAYLYLKINIYIHIFSPTSNTITVITPQAVETTNANL